MEQRKKSLWNGQNTLAYCNETRLYGGKGFVCGALTDLKFIWKQKFGIQLKFSKTWAVSILGRRKKNSRLAPKKKEFPIRFDVTK